MYYMPISFVNTRNWILFWNECFTDKILKSFFSQPSFNRQYRFFYWIFSHLKWQLFLKLNVEWFFHNIYVSMIWSTPSWWNPWFREPLKLWGFACNLRIWKFFQKKTSKKVFKQCLNTREKVEIKGVNFTNPFAILQVLFSFTNRILHNENYPLLHARSE